MIDQLINLHYQPYILQELKKYGYPLDYCNLKFNHYNLSLYFKLIIF